MEALPVIMMAAGTAMDFLGSRKQASAMKDARRKQEAAAEQSRRIAGRNAARIEAETKEKVRREKLAAEEAQSMRKARAAAGGGTLTGSTGAFLEEQASREGQYIDWLKRSGASQAAIERARGEYSYLTGMAEAEVTGAQAEGAKWDALSSLVSGGTELYGYGSKQGWWGV